MKAARQSQPSKSSTSVNSDDNNDYNVDDDDVDVDVDVEVKRKVSETLKRGDSIARYRFQLTFNCKRVCCLDQSKSNMIKNTQQSATLPIYSFSLSHTHLFTHLLAAHCHFPFLNEAKIIMYFMAEARWKADWKWMQSTLILNGSFVNEWWNCARE